MVNRWWSGMAVKALLLQPVNGARPMRAGRGACLVAACLVVFGCSGGPTVVLDTPTGPVALNSPGPAMPGSMVGPPPGMDVTQPSVPAAPNTAGRNGTYTGTAEPLNTGGGLCISTQAVDGFIVRGTSVRYGRFRGRIAADNGLQMVNGQNWIIGQFEGPTFHGQLDTQGRFGSFGCTYMLSLRRTGP
jgi:hypothetical protein